MLIHISDKLALSCSFYENAFSLVLVNIILLGSFALPSESSLYINFHMNQIGFLEEFHTSVLSRIFSTCQSVNGDNDDDDSMDNNDDSSNMMMDTLRWMICEVYKLNLHLVLLSSWGSFSYTNSFNYWLSIIVVFYYFSYYCLLWTIFENLFVIFQYNCLMQRTFTSDGQNSYIWLILIWSTFLDYTETNFIYLEPFVGLMTLLIGTRVVFLKGK